MDHRTDTKAVVLAALADGPKHGYAIANAVRETSAGTLKLGEGQLYPTLCAIEAEGWVTGEWDEEDANRREYRLTDASRAGEARGRWHAFADAVARVLPQV